LIPVSFFADPAAPGLSANMASDRPRNSASPAMSSTRTQTTDKIVGEQARLKLIWWRAWVDERHELAVNWMRECSTASECLTSLTNAKTRHRMGECSTASECLTSLTNAKTRHRMGECSTASECLTSLSNAKTRHRMGECSTASECLTSLTNAKTRHRMGVQASHRGASGSDGETRVLRCVAHPARAALSLRTRSLEQRGGRRGSRQGSRARSRRRRRPGGQTLRREPRTNRCGTRPCQRLQSCCTCTPRCARGCGCKGE
jgi:hypothetical protein